MVYTDRGTKHRPIYIQITNVKYSEPTVFYHSQLKISVFIFTFEVFFQLLFKHIMQL